MSWSTHINEIANKARRKIGLIYRQFYTMSSSKSRTLTALYFARKTTTGICVTSVGPFPDEGCSEAGIGTKVMCCKNWGSRYSENLQQTALPELSSRRSYLSLSYFYNLINGHFEFPDIPARVREPAYNTRSSHASVYVQPFAHSNYYLYSFFPKTISLWNSLPSNVMSSTSISSFKRNVCSHLY